MSRESAAERQRKLELDKAKFLAKGGRIQPAEPMRRNPLREDRHNTFLFLGKR